MVDKAARSQKPEVRMERSPFWLLTSGSWLLFPFIVNVSQAVFRFRKWIFLGDLNGFVDFPVDAFLDVFDIRCCSDPTLDQKSFELPDGIAFFPDDAVAALQNAGAAGVAEDFLRVRARERIARDFFAALDAFEKEGIPRTLGDSQIGADGRQQIRGKNIVDGNEVSLFRKALEFAEVRLDHGNKFTVPTESESSIDSFQFIEKETYYYIT